MNSELQERIEKAEDPHSYFSPPSHKNPRGTTKWVDRAKEGLTKNKRGVLRYLYLGSHPGPVLDQRPTPDAASHVVTEVEKMLRQARPAGKASDPRETKDSAPRAPVVGFAYLLADEQGRVKIGAATDVLQRRADLQVGNADDLTILAFIPTDDMYALESALKAHYRHVRTGNGGTEWFRRDAVEPFFGTEGLS